MKQKTGESKILKNKLLLSSIFLFGLILFSTGVMAANAVTLNIPVTDEGINGATVLLNSSTDTNTVNLTRGVYSWEVPGISSSNTTIANITNHTGAAGELTYWNYSWDTTGMVDVNNITIWIHVYAEEAAGTNSTDLNTGIDVDNGLPTATLGNSHFSTGTNVKEKDSFTVAVDADNTIGINSCRVFFTNTQTSDVDNITIFDAVSNACSNSITLSDVDGLTIGNSYNVIVQVEDDNTNKTNSSDRVLVTRKVSGASTTTVIAPTGIQKITSGISNTGFNIASAIQNFINTITSFFNRITN